MDDDEQVRPNVGALIPVHVSEHTWRPIFHFSTQVVLYNPLNHALTVRHSRPPSPTSSLCPYCKRPLDNALHADEKTLPGLRIPTGGRAPNYFQLLAVSNEEATQPRTAIPASPQTPTSPPGPSRTTSSQSANQSSFAPSALADGYFDKFFREERRLGMGANGSVYLCQVS